MIQDLVEKYDKKLQEMELIKGTKVFINACTHGSEQIGIPVIDEIQKLSLDNGGIICNIANERAISKNIDFIESDLNRSFPGKKEGNYEEQLAYHIHRLVVRADIVIDIHSTETTDLGAESALVVTKIDEATKEIVRLLAPPKVLIMKATKNNSSISEAKIGIGFEYGKDTSIPVKNAIVSDIKKILYFLSLIDTEEESNHFNIFNTQCFEVANVLENTIDGFLVPGIENYKYIQKGDKVAKNDHGDILYATKNFYPILFKESRYKGKEYFGFMGEKIDCL